jgi:prolyl oligopeptidase
MLRAMRQLWVVVIAACCPPPVAKPAAPPAAVTVAPPPVEPVPVVVPPPAGPPVARTVDVIDHEFGLVAPDPYRWMEGGENAEATAWLKAHGDHGRATIAKLPGRDALHARVRELGLARSGLWGTQIQSGVTIQSSLPANVQLARLVVRDKDGSERILIDPDKLGSADRHASLNAYSLSPDGKRVGYVIAMGGGEVGAIHVMDIASGKELADTTDRIWGEFAPQWLPDSSGYFYTQMVPPPPGGDPIAGMIARLHKLGDSADKDITIIGRDAGATLALAPQEFPIISVQPGTAWVVAVAAGARSEYRIAVAKLADLDRKGSGKTPWKIVAEYSDGVENMVLHGDRIYLQTYKDAPNRKLISVPLASPAIAKARVEVAEDPAGTLAWIAPAKDAVYIVHDAGGRARLSRWAWAGKATTIQLPIEGWIGEGATDVLRDGITFELENWLRIGAFHRYDPAKKLVSPAGFGMTSPSDTSMYAVTDVEVASFDGAKVPLSILHRKDIALDGSHPTLVEGYGAYGVSIHPGYGETRLAWLERGGVIAIAHVRGGGEKGRQWQDDGSRDKKLNGIRDLIACGEYLVDKKYTSRAKLGAQGGSAGGILVGRAITERPDLFAAVNISVGMVNPLRLLAAQNGANQIAEVGDPRTEAGYKQIFAMDPYQHVAPATAYPAVLFTVGLNDNRVTPWMTSKMAARLMASTTSGKPILIRTEDDAGHGIGSTRDQAYAETADVWSFLLHSFGDPAF